MLKGFLQEVLQGLGFMGFWTFKQGCPLQDRVARRKLEEEKEKEHIAVEEDLGTRPVVFSALFGSILESI